jgi:hypothetical protein
MVQEGASRSVLTKSASCAALCPDSSCAAPPTAARRWRSTRTKTSLSACWQVALTDAVWLAGEAWPDGRTCQTVALLSSRSAPRRQRETTGMPQ